MYIYIGISTMYNVYLDIIISIIFMVATVFVFVVLQPMHVLLPTDVKWCSSYFLLEGD